jgi:hypothetical protein
MSGKTINTNLALRLKGWRAALRSKKTPPWLRDSIRRNIRGIEARLRRRKGPKKDLLDSSKAKKVN